MTGRSAPHLTLALAGREVLRVGVSTTVGRALLKGAHEDARFLADEQFRLRADARQGHWFVEPLSGTPNETLLDGDPLVSPAPLKRGSVIAVGNSRKGVIKLPLVVGVDAPAVPSETSRGADARGTAGDEEVAARAPDAAPATEAAPEAETSSSQRWGQAKCIARVAGSVAGAILMGLLNGAGSGGSCVYVRRGRDAYGDILLTVVGQRVYKGRNAYGSPVLTLDGNTVRRGGQTWGDVVAHLDGELVRGGSASWGEVVARLDGEYVREGRSSWGNVLARVHGGRRMAGAVAAAYLVLY